MPNPEQALALKAKKTSAFLKKRKVSGPIQAADVMTGTGLSAFEVEDSLRILMKEYPCRLTVNEEGVLQYHFDWTKRQELSQSKRILQYLLYPLKLLFKFCMVLMLFIFGLIYGGFLAIGIAGLAKSPSPILIWLSGLFLSVKALVLDVAEDIRLLGKKEHEGKEMKKDNVFFVMMNYVFGEKRAIREKRAHDALRQRVLRYIHRNDYQLTSADLVSITGWPIYKAEEEVTELLTRYDGEVEVDENAVIRYRFEGLRDGADSQTTGSIYVWDSLPPYRFLHRPQLDDEVLPVIILMLSLGFIGTLFMLIFTGMEGYELDVSFFLPDGSTPWYGWWFVSFWGTWFSFFFCLAFFFLPIRRRFLDEQQIKRLSAKMKVQRAYKWVFTQLQSGQAYFKDSLFPEYLKSYLKQLRLELEGEPAVDEQGEAIQRYPRLAREWSRNDLRFHLADHLIAREGNAYYGGADGLRQALLFMGLALCGLYTVATAWVDLGSLAQIGLLTGLAFLVLLVILGTREGTFRYTEDEKALQKLFTEDEEVTALNLSHTPGSKKQSYRYFLYAEGLTGFTSIKELKLRVQKAYPKQNKHLLAVVSSLPNIEKLSLEEVHNPPSVLFEHPTLKHLKLQLGWGGGMGHLPDRLESTPKLEVLDLERMRIENYPDWLPDIPKVIGPKR